MERWLIAVCLLAVALDARSQGQRFGLVMGDGESACLATSRDISGFPQPVRIVVPGGALEPTVLRAQIVSIFPEPCEAFAESEPYSGQAPQAYYALRVEHGPGKWSGVADFATLPATSFRSCTSSEGLHFTVWAGGPLRSRRLWSAYAYLGYDVEPTCSDGEIAQ